MDHYASYDNENEFLLVFLVSGARAAVSPSAIVALEAFDFGCCIHTVDGKDLSVKHKWEDMMDLMTEWRRAIDTDVE